MKAAGKESAFRSWLFERGFDEVGGDVHQYVLDAMAAAFRAGWAAGQMKAGVPTELQADPVRPPDAVEIPLSNGGITYVDPDVAKQLAGKKVWATAPPNMRRYAAINGTCYGLKRTVPLSRFILRPPDDLEVDHINGDPLDNRRANLRIVTRSENQANRANKNAGRYGRFVSFWANRYRVRIRNEGRIVYQSAHYTLAEAQAVAHAEALRLLGPSGIDW